MHALSVPSVLQKSLAKQNSVTQSFQKLVAHLCMLLENLLTGFIHNHLQYDLVSSVFQQVKCQVSLGFSPPLSNYLYVQFLAEA